MPSILALKKGTGENNENPEKNSYNLLFLFTFIIAAAIILIGRNIATNLIKQQVTNNLINTTQSRTEHIKTFLDLEREAVKQLSESIVIRELLLSTEE